MRWSRAWAEGRTRFGGFHAFLDDPDGELHGVEAAGDGLETGRHAAPLSAGGPASCTGTGTYLMQDADGQIEGTHSVSAGLDYPGVGPEHAWLKDIGRAVYTSATDAETLAAFERLTRIEGIIPALESSHALAHAEKLARERPSSGIVIVNLSGRGDKDIPTVAALQGIGDLAG